MRESLSRYGPLTLPSPAQRGRGKRTLSPRCSPHSDPSPPLGRGQGEGVASMPELPDITAYLEALDARVMGARLERVRLASPFVLRSFDPPISSSHGRAVTGLRRLGKRIVIGLEGDLFLVIHLMIAGRLHWKAAGARVPGQIGLAAFDFTTGTLTLTEAGTKKRAAIHLVHGKQA